jgi:hypothetical protein
MSQAGVLSEIIAAVRADGRRRNTRCPAHQDNRASLSVGLGQDSRVLLKCHATCTTAAVLEAAGLDWADVFNEGPRSMPRVVATYRYHNEMGEHLFNVVRLHPKDFRQQRADGAWKMGNVRRVVYRLDKLQGKPTVYCVEGEKDADSLWALGIPSTTAPGGAGKWRDDYADQLKAAAVETVVIVPDNDAPGRAHAEQVAKSCYGAGLRVKTVALPNLPDKGDVSDFLGGHTRDELVTLVDASPDWMPAAPAETVKPCPLPVLHETFRRWLGADYDLDAVNAVVATAAAERLSGDPLWLLLVSGSGNAKTETVQALSGVGATITSTITSDGALLSGSPKRDKAIDATGGLLRTIGPRGLLVIKDVTSILSMNRDTRGTVLAALREIHDGRWERNVGTDGGRTLSWVGRLAIIGAVTTVWDRAHDVIAAMGDRFVVLRMDSTLGRLPAGRQAIGNTGNEATMRAELASAVAGVLAGVRTDQNVSLTAVETERILQAANVVTLARTGVDYDYRGDVVDAHAPEMPTRFAKQLAQVVRGAVAIGMDRAKGLALAIRCARDSMPPIRLAILDDINKHPDSLTKDVRRRLAKPRATIDRQLQALHMLGVLTCDEEEATHAGKAATLWRYRLAHGIDPSVLTSHSVPEMSPPYVESLGKGDTDPLHEAVVDTDISGTEHSRGPITSTDWADANERSLPSNHLALGTREVR